MERDLIKYPYLPEGKEIKYVPISNPFMARAKELARKSNDQQQPTGAVIVLENKAVAEASNKNPLSSPALIKIHKKYCIRHMLKIPTGEKYWMCPGCATYKSHGEHRAVAELRKNFPEKINASLDLYLWGHWWCCQPCWDEMISVGIKNVYLLDESFELFNLSSKKNILGHQFDK
jgi:deoxycytidylate deaminase